MTKLIIIDNAKNTVEVNLTTWDYEKFFSGQIDMSKIKKHKTLKDLDKTIHDFIKKEG